MSDLYPLKFVPIFKEKIWGGQRLNSIIGKNTGDLKRCGESWEISGVEGSVSVVAEGFLKGRDLISILKEYKGALVGEKVYQYYKDVFPLLIKFIDANEDLSVQVHPDDKLAKERHDSLGKTEMWYIIDAEKEAKINVGFNKKISKDQFVKYVQDHNFSDILNYEKAQKGDVFYLPPGRIHYIGKGVLLTEIQQSSDVTYRIYDFDRIDVTTGEKRELHTELAMDAIDYNCYDQYKTPYIDQMNTEIKLVSDKYFTTNKLILDHTFTKDYQDLDSFVIFINLGGEGTLFVDSNKTNFNFGDVLLLPAQNKKISIKPNSNQPLQLLEVYIDNLIIL